MAVALAPHRISVTAVEPSFIATEHQTPQLARPRGEELRSQSHRGRVGTPEEGAAVHYLTSAEATWPRGRSLTSMEPPTSAPDTPSPYGLQHDPPTGVEFPCRR